jgi:hypothetical protein
VKRRNLFLALVESVTLYPFFADARSANTITSIGYLHTGSLAFGTSRIDACVAGMRADKVIK